MKRRKLHLGLAGTAAVLAVLLLTGGVVAYLIAKSSPIPNAFSAGKVLCDVVETFDGTSKTSVRLSNKAGEEMATVDQYMRLKLVSYWVDTSGTVLGKSAQPVHPGESDAAGDTETTFVLNSDWLYDEATDAYYYTRIVPAAETESLTSDLLAEGHQIILKQDTSDGSYQALEVFGESIQAAGQTAAGKPAVETEWPVTVGDDGTLSLVSGS